ncbi:MAG TPA: helix-turn-helix transcriptional regulator [Myxococcales bacterium]|nr:helix-turn-helix transcriptional regulator [Myxococcales bacterium]
MNQDRQRLRNSLAHRLGVRIRRLRRRRAMSQEELAERAGISVSFLSMLERGRRLPHLETVVKLADVLGVTLSQFFDLDARD